MPFYEIEFAAPITVSDPSIYINKCCWGGDVVRDRLLPRVSELFPQYKTHQEDWGWFIWARHGNQKIEVNITCDDPTAAIFRVHLVAKKRKGWFSKEQVKTPELEQLKVGLVAELNRWGSVVAIRLEA